MPHKKNGICCRLRPWSRGPRDTGTHSGPPAAGPQGPHTADTHCRPHCGGPTHTADSPRCTCGSPRSGAGRWSPGSWFCRSRVEVKSAVDMTSSGPPTRPNTPHMSHGTLHRCDPEGRSRGGRWRRIVPHGGVPGGDRKCSRLHFLSCTGGMMRGTLCMCAVCPGRSGRGMQVSRCHGGGGGLQGEGHLLV